MNTSKIWPPERFEQFSDRKFSEIKSRDSVGAARGVLIHLVTIGWKYHPITFTFENTKVAYA